MVLACFYEIPWLSLLISEKVTVPRTKTNVTFQGQGFTSTAIAWNDTANSSHGTSFSGSVQVYSTNFIAKNITFMVRSTKKKNIYIYIYTHTHTQRNKHKYIYTHRVQKKEVTRVGSSRAGLVQGGPWLPWLFPFKNCAPFLYFLLKKM